MIFFKNLILKKKINKFKKLILMQSKPQGCLSNYMSLVRIENKTEKSQNVYLYELLESNTDNKSKLTC